MAAGRFGDRVTLRWRWSDADGGRRWYTVLYSPDGQRVIPWPPRSSATSLRVDLTTLPGGPRARFEVIAKRRRAHRQRPLRPAVLRPRQATARPRSPRPRRRRSSSRISRSRSWGAQPISQDGTAGAGRLSGARRCRAPSAPPGRHGDAAAGTHVITLMATNEAGVGRPRASPSSWSRSTGRGRDHRALRQEPATAELPAASPFAGESGRPRPRWY